MNIPFIAHRREKGHEQDALIGSLERTLSQPIKCGFAKIPIKTTVFAADFLNVAECEFCNVNLGPLRVAAANSD